MKHYNMNLHLNGTISIVFSKPPNLFVHFVNSETGTGEDMGT